MDENTDIRHLLDEWPYDTDDNVRVVALPDGRSIMQVRLPMGVEQYDMDGRPDGARPHGMESVLDYHRARLARAAAEGTSAVFRLSGEDCAELFDEGVIYYYRYLHLFRIEDWPRTIRDTARNMALFDFVKQHAERDEDREHLEQWRPYIVRINAAARAMDALKKRRHARALEIVQTAVEKIEGIADLDAPTFAMERERSVRTLKEMARQIERNRPVGKLERLENQLTEAVASEEYERAAALRDRINALRADRV